MNNARRVVVITGGGSGIGLATAKRFAHDGAAVVIADVDVQQGSEAAAAIGAAGGAAAFIHRDENRVDTIIVSAATSVDEALVFPDSDHADWWLQARGRNPIDFTLHYLAGLKARIEGA